LPSDPQEAEKRKEAAELTKLLGKAMDTFADLTREPVQSVASQEKVTNLLGSLDLAGTKLDRMSLRNLLRAMAEFSASIRAR
jgi:hypothetical protein